MKFFKTVSIKCYHYCHLYVTHRIFLKKIFSFGMGLTSDISKGTEEIEWTKKRRHKIKWHYLKLLIERGKMRIYSSLNRKMGKQSQREQCTAQNPPINFFPFHATIPFNFLFYYQPFAKIEDARLIFEAKQRSKRYRKMWLKFSGEPRCQFRIQAF